MQYLLFQLQPFLTIDHIFFFRQPKVVTATDEADLARRMERAELENAEIDGDVEGESDDDDEGLKFDEEGNAASSEEEDAKN